jgi:hypothetical protein
MSSDKNPTKDGHKTSLNRVHKSDAKVPRLHLEVVKARVRRAKMAKRRPVSE